MSYIMTKEGLVLNSMAGELGRGGYTQGNASTSEAQLLTARGYMRAFEVTRDGKYLTRGALLGDAYVKYFANDSMPPSSDLWANQWIVNGGLPFAVKGPSSPSGSDFDGYVLRPKTVGVGGVVALETELANVYNVFTNGTTLSWQNVFASINTGSYVTWTEFWDKNGNRFTPSGIDLSTPTDPTKIGKLYTSATSGATVLVNYSVYIPTVMIPYGSIYECWPMWREIDKTVWNCAGDAIHWMVDAFEMLKNNDTANVSKWSQCKSGALRLWYDATSPNVETFMFKKEIGKRYSAWPGTFWRYITSGVTYTEPNLPTGYAITRNDLGFIEATLPSDLTRTSYQLWNEKLWLTYTPVTSSMSIEVGATVDTNVRLLIWADDNKAYQTMFKVVAGGPAIYNIPMTNMLNMYVWPTSTGVVPTFSHLHDVIDYCAVTIPDNTAGFGFPVSWTTAGSVTFKYKSTSSFTLRIQHGGSYTDHYISPATTFTTFTIPEANGYGVQVLGIGVGGSTVYCTTSLTYYQGSESSVASCELIVESTAATVLQLGSVYVVGSTRDEVNYTPGALLFQTSSGENTVNVNGNSGAPFQGPFYVGYQNPCPWFLQGYITEAENMLQLMSDAQVDYTSKFPGVIGPFTPVYNQNTWDAAGTYTLGFNWEGPDPNTFWGGWQYRAFSNVADYWQRTKTAYQTNNATTLAETICTKFIAWLIEWIADNPAPTHPCLPTYFGSNGSITVGYSEPHMVALALKGAVWSHYAAPTTQGLVQLIDDLHTMLVDYQIQTGPMYGSFSPDPTNHAFYGYWAGEIMDAIAVYAKWKVAQ